MAPCWEKPDARNLSRQARLLVEKAEIDLRRSAFDWHAAESDLRKKRADDAGARRSSIDGNRKNGQQHRNGNADSQNAFVP